MTPGKIVAAIFGVLFAPAAVGLLVGGIALIVIHVTARDSDGFVHSPAYEFSTADYALTSGEISLAPLPGDWWPTDLFDVRLSVESTDGTTIFIGIGPSDEVEAYLGAVARSRVIGLGDRRNEISYRHMGEEAPTAAPGEQSFWVRSATTADQQSITWEVERGDWSLVIMNADGSAGVTANTEFGAKIPVLQWIGIGLAIGGLILGGLAAGLLVIAFGRGAQTRDDRSSNEGFSTAGSTTYPVIVEGYIDEPLSRWMWLVKWFLAIPHFIILAFLWFAFGVMTFLAFFAILFTGRYPRPIFDFNVGVMRWSWRVVFYCSNVLATDRYPPFTLSATDYPAQLDVAYPEQLSRGLVLVKWWLLAIPHYLIVGLFTSGLIWWTTDAWGGNTVLEIGGGLIGILALIAALILLFSGKYPRSLFDLLMGLSRWVIRVAAYASLMRDEYPPFRLDIGGREPGLDSSGDPQSSDADPTKDKGR